ncbi:MAG TPA: ABC transporter ATP-binding protein [Desulfobacteraceae bacterium]|nr:ABC transporter ATP-binding protein [Desulfobacteraceae bacterium]
MLLELNNIEVIYADVILVIKGLSLSVPEEDIVTLIGNNGAGKSTTLKGISGLIVTENGQVTQGSITYQGRRINGVSPAKIAQMGIVQVIEGRHIFEELTVEENLITGAINRQKGIDLKRDFDNVYEYFPALKDKKKRIAGYLSGGEQQMLAIGRAFLTKPKIFLLDEPSLGLAPILTEELFGIIKTMNEREGTSVLLVEQNANAALRIASYGYVMENGQIVMEGDSEELLENKNVKEFYLGINQEGVREQYKNPKYYKRKKRWFSSEQE